MNNEDQIKYSKKDILKFAAQFDGVLIYKTNAFRLLQLPVTVTDREITRRKQVIDISTKTQAFIPDGPGKLLPKDLTDNSVDINLLVESLREPLARFNQEFFWFWPLPDNKYNFDPALSALATGDSTRAIEIWKEPSSYPKTKAVGLHNLAVYYHFLALDESTQCDPEELLYNWNTSHQNWKELVALDDFWSLLDNRVREINDPRLTLNHVNQLRQATLTIISYTNAKEAARIAESGNNEGVRSLLEAFNKALGDSSDSANILKLALALNRERLEIAGSLVEEKSKTDPAHVDNVVEALLVEGRKQLKIIKAILPKGHPDFDLFKSELLQRSLNGIDAFFKKTDDWQRALELIKFVDQFNLSAKFRIEVVKRVDGLNEFGKISNYWCCKGYYNDELPLTLFQELERARKAFDHQDYDEAIRILELLTIENTHNPNLVCKAINPPLAQALHRNAQIHIQKGMENFEGPRSVIERIQQNIKMKSSVCLNTAYAALTNDLQNYSRYGQLHCMCCLNPIYGQYVVGQSKELKIVLCLVCNKHDEEELSLRKAKALPFLKKASALLLRASKLRPENKAVTEDLDTVQSLGNKIYNLNFTGADQSDPPSTKRQPPSTPNTPIQPPRPPANYSSGNYRNGGDHAKTPWGIIFFTLIVIVLCVIIGFSISKDSPSPKPTTRPQISMTKSPTKRPTAIPTKKPTKKSTVVTVKTPTSSCRSWNTITLKDVGKYVCVTGTIRKTYWGDWNLFFLTFTDDLTKFRLYMDGGVYIKDVIGRCVEVKGYVKNQANIPMIELISDKSGYISNIQNCK